MPETDKFRQRVLGTIMTHALFSWQVALTVIFAIVAFLLAPAPFDLPSWFWLIAGAVASGAFVLSSLADPQAAQDAISRQFESQFDLGKIRNRAARERLRSALEYRRNMMTLAKRARGSLRTNLLHTVQDINDWIAHMYELAEHIDAFESNELVGRDRRAVPQKIERTRISMEREQDPSVRRELERQMQQLEQQRTNLEATANSVRRAEIQLESTLASLGTIYAQMSLLGSKDVDSARAQRLRLEIQDEVTSLQDTIEAMDEVQAQSLRLS
jgi:hypothetical protein